MGTLTAFCSTMDTNGILQILHWSHCIPCMVLPFTRRGAEVKCGRKQILLVQDEINIIFQESPCPSVSHPSNMPVSQMHIWTGVTRHWALKARSQETWRASSQKLVSGGLLDFNLVLFRTVKKVIFLVRWWWWCWWWCWRWWWWWWWCWWWWWSWAEGLMDKRVTGGLVRSRRLFLLSILLTPAGIKIYFVRSQNDIKDAWSTADIIDYLY